MSNLATITNNILADSGIDDINVVVTTGTYSNPAWITALAWTKITGTPTTIAGYGITNAYTKTEVDTLLSAKQNTLTLTTTGTSGAATLVGATLNIPQYQSVLTNPVTGTGTTNYIPKWTSASAIGNSSIIDDTNYVDVRRDGSSITATIFQIYPLTGTSASIYTANNSGAGAAYWGRQNSAGNSGLVLGVGAYDTVLGHTGSQTLHLVTNTLSRLAISGIGEITTTTSGTVPFMIYGDSALTNGLFRIEIDEVNDSFGTGTRTFLGDGGIDIFIGTANNSYTPGNTYIALNNSGEISMGAGSATKHLTIATTGTARFNAGANPSLVFSGDVANTSASMFEPENGGKTSYFGRENSTGTHTFASAVTPYSTVIAAYNTTAPILIGHNNPEITIANGGNTNFVGKIGINNSSQVALIDIVVPDTYTTAGAFASSAINLLDPTTVGVYSQMTFGYTPARSYAPAYIGYVSTSNSSGGKGDIVIGTRDVTTDTQATERVRIYSTGVVSITAQTYSALLLSGSSTAATPMAVFVNNYPTADNTKYFAQYIGNWASPNTWGIGVRGTNDNTIYLSYASSGIIDPTSTAIELQIGAYKAVKSNRTLTINGTAQDLSADRTWNVGTVTGSGADTRVAYWTSGSGLSSASNFIWDYTNNRLGIGATSPLYTAHVQSSGEANLGIETNNDSATNFSGFRRFKSRGTPSAKTTIVNGDTIAADGHYAYDGTQYRAVVSIVTQSNGVVATNDIPTLYKIRVGKNDASLLDMISLTSAGVYQLNQLTSNGFVKTSGSNGTLSIDTTTYAVDSNTVHIAGTETITGAKTFTAKTTFNSTGYDAILLNGGGGGYNTNAIGIFNGNYPSADNTKYFAQYGGNWPSSNNWGMGVRGANDSTIYMSFASGGVIDVTSTTFNLQLGAYKVLHAGNYNSYALPLSGGTLTGDLTLGNGSDLIITPATSGVNAILYNDIGVLVSSASISVQGTGTFTSSISATGATFSTYGIFGGGSSATSQLDVTSNASANGITLRNRTGDDYAFFNWRTFGGSELLAEQYIQRTAANTAVMKYTIANGSTPSLYLTIAATGAATFDNTLRALRVGVGSAPSATRPLRVVQATGDEWIAEFISTGTNPYGVYIDTSANASSVPSFRIYSNSGGLTFNNNGRLGIGTASPSTTLHIVGDTTFDNYRMKNMGATNQGIFIGNWPGAGYWGLGSTGTAHELRLDQCNTSTGAWENATDVNLYLGTRLVLNSANYSSYALPITGGTINSSSTQPLAIYGDNAASNGLFRIQIDEVNDAFGTGARTFLGDGGIDVFIGTGNNNYTPANTYIALNQSGEISMGAGSATKMVQLSTTGVFQVNTRVYNAIYLSGSSGAANPMGVMVNDYPSNDNTKYYAHYGGNWQSSGNWGMGINGSADNTIYLGQAASGVISTAASVNFKIWGNSYAAAFFENSDKRQKELIEDDYCIEGIENISAKYYLKNGVKEVGYYAQDFEGILDSALSKTTDGFLNLSYNQVHTVKIASLEKRIKELEEQLKNK